MNEFNELRDQMRTFTHERDWAGYHDPKSLILALVGEVGELSELFQWLPADQAAALAEDEPLRQQCRDEISDVLLYLVRLADVLGIDLMSSATHKLSRNATKHPPGDKPIVRQSSRPDTASGSGT
jgi:NTP pyrophosphatase (non-canonical NTP hydrolase)